MWLMNRIISRLINWLINRLINSGHHYSSYNITAIDSDSEDSCLCVLTLKLIKQ